MEPLKKAKDWIRQKWNQGLAFAKDNKGRTAAGCVVVSLFIAGTAIANHYYSSNHTTLYHVYVDGVEIGTVDTPDLVQRYIDQEMAKQKAIHGTLHFEVANQISWQEDTNLRMEATNHQTMEALKDKIELKVTAQALVINGEISAFAKDQATIDTVVEEMKQKYGQLPIANDKSQTAKIASQDSGTFPKEVKLKEKVETKTEKVSPDQVLTKKELARFLEKGTVKDMIHVVQEGDCISCIASQYGITTSDIYRSNPDIHEDTLLQLGQEIVVTASRPQLTVQSIETSVVEQRMDYLIEVKPTETMYRGDTKVVQEGKEGLKKVTYQIVKENGIQTDKTILKEEVLSEPVTKIVHKGTKVKPDRGSGNFSWPTNGGSITSGYGFRWGKMHKGLDIAGSNRTIKAADNGRVVSVGWNGDYGKCIIIDHGNGYQTLYGHLSSFSVSEGEVVEKGEKIGVMGSTGDSTGTHLHFEILKNGLNMNPIKYFRG